MYKGNYYTINGEYIKKNTIEGFTEHLNEESPTNTFTIAIGMGEKILGSLKINKSGPVLFSEKSNFVKVESKESPSIFKLNYIDRVPYLVTEYGDNKGYLCMDQTTIYPKRYNEVVQDIKNARVYGKLSIVNFGGDKKSGFDNVPDINNNWEIDPDHVSMYPGDRATVGWKRKILFNDLDQLGFGIAELDGAKLIFINTITNESMSKLPSMTLTSDSGANITGRRTYIKDSENKGRVRVGAAWGIPGIYSEDTEDLVLGVADTKSVHLGTSGSFASFKNGELTAKKLCINNTCINETDLLNISVADTKSAQLGTSDDSSKNGEINAKKICIGNTCINETDLINISVAAKSVNLGKSGDSSKNGEINAKKICIGNTCINETDLINMKKEKTSGWFW